MFIIQWLDRNTTRSAWNKLWPIIRKHDRPVITDESVLAERAQIAQEIADCTEDGKVAVVTSGRDCDCAEYVWSTLREGLHPMLFMKERQDSYYWADGPIHVGICKPSERPENHSRDLALEAYEDGHPHIVSSVRFDEEGMY